jgi:hypothetical protein
MAGDGKLTAVSVKAAAEGKHFDGGGLFLHVMQNGARYWRLKYRYAGKEKLLALGVYPEISLAEARRARETARAALRDGSDPSCHHRHARSWQAGSATATRCTQVAAARETTLDDELDAIAGGSGLVSCCLSPVALFRDRAVSN